MLPKFTNMLKKIYITELAVSVLGFMLLYLIYTYVPFGQPKPVQGTDIGGFIEQLLFPIVFIFIASSLILITLNLEKRNFVKKILIIGFGAGIFFAFIFTYIIGTPETQMQQLFRNLFALFVLSIGSVTSVTLLATKYMRITSKTTATGATLFLISFLFNMFVFTLVLLTYTIYTFGIIGFFFLITLVHSLFAVRYNKNVDCEKGTFRVIDIVELKKDERHRTDSKTEIHAVHQDKENKGKTVTIYPKTGRAMLEADQLEPGDFFKCFYFVKSNKKEDTIYICREMKKL